MGRFNQAAQLLRASHPLCARSQWAHVKKGRYSGSIKFCGVARQHLLLATTLARMQLDQRKTGRVKEIRNKTVPSVPHAPSALYRDALVADLATSGARGPP